jgi:hypothetical protein
MYKKNIICLANSRKPGGRCVAGKVLTGQKVGAWIRPVSERTTHEMSDGDRLYKDRTLADVFDIVEIAFREPAPIRHQSENHLIASDKYWQKQGTATWKQIQEALDEVSGPLWLNGSSTYHGLYDKVKVSALDDISDSLKLVKVNDLAINVEHEPGWQGAPGRRRVRGSFTLNGESYKLVVTDPTIESEYLAKSIGDYALGSAILCVSLSEPMHDFAFKLIATVITKARLAAK